MHGHPLVWLWLLLAGSTVAVNTSNPLLLLLMAAAFVAAGVLAGGPRRANLGTALGAGLVATLIWIALTLAMPPGSPGDALLVLPSWTPGPGVTFGGPLDAGSAVSGLVAALRAVVVLLLLGLAGQLVSARGWLALSRSTLGLAAPALHPVATLGEAGIEARRTRQRVARQGWGRGASADGLTALLLAGRDLARADQPRSAPRPGVELVRLVALLALASVPVLALASGLLPPAITDHVFGTDVLALIVVAAVAIGLVLPGTPPLLWQFRAGDLLQAGAALALTLAWVLRGPLGQIPHLSPPLDAVPGLPWALVGAVVLVPVAVGLTSPRTPTPAVTARA